MDEKQTLELAEKFMSEMKDPKIVGLSVSLARFFLEKYPESAKAICALMTSFVLRAQTSNKDEFDTCLYLHTLGIETSPEDISRFVEKKSVTETQH